MPTKAHPTDACFDLYADIQEPIVIPPHEAASIPTGIMSAIPNNYCCKVYGRSGMGIKRGLRPSNCVGIIDSDYRGEWMVGLHNDSDQAQVIKPGDRIAQFSVDSVINCELVKGDTLDATDRGEGGFGSTGQ